MTKRDRPDQPSRPVTTTTDGIAVGTGPSSVPASREPDRTPAGRGNADSDVADFVKRLRTAAPQTGTRGRLVFAMDATMSRQPTWDMALALQAEMFHAVKAIGGLDVQLVFFRGAGECRSSKWVSDPDALARLMTTVRCAGG